MRKTWLTWAFLGMAACAGKPATPVATTAPVPALASAVPPIGQTLVISHGATPQSVLRLSAPLGTETGLTMRMTLAMEPSQFAIPPIVVSTLAKVTAVSPTGVMTSAATITGYTVEGGTPDVVAALETMSAKLRRLVMTLDVAPNGTIANVQMAGADDPDIAAMAEQIRSATEQSVVPLPDTPIGPGATWRHRQRSTNNGFGFINDLTYELRSVVDRKATLTLTGTITGDPHVEGPDAPPVSLRDIHGTLAGTLVIDLARNGVTGTMTTNINMTMVVGDQQQPVTQTINIELSST